MRLAHPAVLYWYNCQAADLYDEHAAAYGHEFEHMGSRVTQDSGTLDISAAAHTRPAKRRHLARTIIIGIVIVLACCIGAYAYMLLNSMNTMKGDMQQISADYKTLATQTITGDATQANAAAVAITEHVGKVQAQANSWVWNVAAALPVYGEDVGIMRTLVQVSNDLANQVAVPVTEKYSVLLADKVIDADGNLDAAKLVMKAGEVSDMVITLQDAKAVVAQCDQTVNELPPAHFQELNDSIVSAREGMDSLDKTFQTIDPLLTKASQLEESVTALLNQLSAFGISL